MVTLLYTEKRSFAKPIINKIIPKPTKTIVFEMFPETGIFEGVGEPVIEGFKTAEGEAVTAVVGVEFIVGLGVVVKVPEGVASPKT